MLRECLLKRIADDLTMKEDFEAWCDFLRDAADDMDDEEKGNDPSDQAHTHSFPPTESRIRRENAAVMPPYRAWPPKYLLSTKRRIP